MVVNDSNVDHFTLSTVASPQAGGAAFPLTITACDIDGNPILVYNGTAALTALGHSGSLPITPESLTFTSGVWTGNVTVNALDPNVVLRLDNGTGPSARATPLPYRPARWPASSGARFLPPPTKGSRSL